MLVATFGSRAAAFWCGRCGTDYSVTLSRSWGREMADDEVCPGCGAVGAEVPCELPAEWWEPIPGKEEEPFLAVGGADHGTRE